MALHLTERLSNPDVARFVQLVIEYDPQPPAGPIAWDYADVRALSQIFMQRAEQQLEDRPDLVERLLRP